MYRVRTTFTGPAGGPYLNTMYFLEGGGTAQQAANAAGAFWGTVDAVLNTAVSWSTGTQVDEVNQVTGEVIGSFAVTASTGVGANAADLLPRVAQGLVRLRTGVYVNSREVRGRWFIPGVCEDACGSGGQVLTTLGTPVAAALATLIADANSEVAIYSPKNAAAYHVTNGSLWNQFASLRSRRD